MMRAIAVIPLTLLIAMVASYPSRSQHRRADLVYLNPSGIHTLDPARMSWTQDFRVALNLWEGLTTWDPQSLEPREAAATLPPDVSNDGLKYTFHLREDGRWSNGDVVTSADFVRGWRRAMEPGTAADYAVLLTDYVVGAAEYVDWRHATVRRLQESSLTAQERADILRKSADEMDDRFSSVGLGTPDDRTFVIHLTRPCPYFLDLTSFPTLLPVHRSIEALRARHDDLPITREGLVVFDPQWTKPDYRRGGYPGLVTNGPYRLENWRFKGTLSMGVNPHYRHRSTMQCRTVDMVVYDNISTAIMAYEVGDIDFLPSMAVPYDHEIARLAKGRQRPDFHLCPVSATYFLNLNCTSETLDGVVNPFLDARVRRAFALSIDREAIVKNVLRRGDRVADSFVPRDAVPGYDPPKMPVYDPHGAKQSLADAGFPDGVGLPTIDFLYTATDERACQAIARMWETNLGARVELRSKETKTFAEDKQRHRFMVTRGNWYADYNDPTTFLDCLISGNGNNDSGYSNGEYDRLMVSASSERDVFTRMRLLQQAEAIALQRDFPIVPILHYAEPIAIKPGITGIHPNGRMWFPFRFVGLEGR